MLPGELITEDDERCIGAVFSPTKDDEWHTLASVVPCLVISVGYDTLEGTKVTWMIDKDGHYCGTFMM